MANEDLLYIEDTDNRKLFYRFTPAAVVSNFVPLVVVLHGEEKAEATNLEYKMWNVLTPLDNFGYKNKGSCWLGEKGDFFVKDLLQELIKQIAEEYECEEHIYMYGSSAGGYGAILHGILCKANAVYAHNPRVKLRDINSKENDLTNFLNATEAFPIFYLCDNVDSTQNSDEYSLEDETAYFVNACEKYAIKAHVDFRPKSVDNENNKLKEVLNFFEHVASQV